MVPARQDSGNGAGRVTAKAVSQQPLAREEKLGVGIIGVRIAPRHPAYHVMHATSPLVVWGSRQQLPLRGCASCPRALAAECQSRRNGDLRWTTGSSNAGFLEELAAVRELDQSISRAPDS